MKRILNVYNKSSALERQAGLYWYLDARKFCRSLAKRSGVSYIKICGILAALSPFTSWQQNKKDCEGFLAMELGGVNYKCTTFGLNVGKAYNILWHCKDRAAILKELHGNKIKAFFDNIYSAKSTLVTIDRHIINCLKGYGAHKKYSLTKNRYARLQGVFQKQAKTLKIKPYQLQAIVWVTYKRIIKERGLVNVK